MTRMPVAIRFLLAVAAFSFRVLVFVIVAAVGVPALGYAQWLHYPTADVPRKADGSPDLTAPAPRLPNGKPDLSGIWHTAVKTRARRLRAGSSSAAPKSEGRRWHSTSAETCPAACHINPGRLRS